MDATEDATQKTTAEQREHADRFKDLVRRAAKTPKGEFDKAEEERKKLEATGKK